jgi:putative transposase
MRDMKWKKHTPEEIVGKLARVRAAVESGAALADAISVAGVSEATYFRWRAQYGSLSADQLQVLKRLELENARLRRALNELELGGAAA